MIYDLRRAEELLRLFLGILSLLFPADLRRKISRPSQIFRVEANVSLSACLMASQGVEALVANHSKTILASSIDCGRLITAQIFQTSNFIIQTW
ncbi:MAG TPA: hypothetical protein DEQ87_05635 [Algoriphagus sp.]|nr:hypothetical protein [Algoriphagus sp.]MAN86318.1 hypothetical protein [Algoriphagus sp.]HAD51300.1 hypothetical protein [Algoriphagus sp.]HAH39144.1 hypothetical protein [Algoriphagus sp.]HAS60968.1 hypothetical protein [Algoriphagus sp.]